MLAHLIIYLLSFVGVWVGSGLAIKSVERLSRTLKVSSFAISFITLGFFTSIGELSVGLNSIIKNDPEIYVGNLIGATIVIFMLIIPLLAILGNSIRITPEFKGFNLAASLVVISLPVILAMDGRVGRTDSYSVLILFTLLLISVQSRRGLIERLKSITPKPNIKLGKELVKIAFGLATIFISSRFIVEQTLYFSNLLNISPFLISLMAISLGTNIPELSLVLRSAFIRNHQIAFGNYVGSAAFNTFLLGLLTLIYGDTVYLTNSYLVSLLFLIFGLIAFYYFARTKNTISRLEGVFLLLIYLAFISTEIILH